MSISSLIVLLLGSFMLPYLSGISTALQMVERAVVIVGYADLDDKKG